MWIPSRFCEVFYPDETAGEGKIWSEVGRSRTGINIGVTFATGGNLLNRGKGLQADVVLQKEEEESPSHLA